MTITNSIIEHNFYDYDTKEEPNLAETCEQKYKNTYDAYIPYILIPFLYTK